MILSFTTSSYAYGKNANESKELLKKELTKRNTQAKYYYIANVSSVKDGEGIEHYLCENTMQMVCQTSGGIKIPFERLEF